jgi:hypothetical protein
VRPFCIKARPPQKPNIRGSLQPIQGLLTVESKTDKHENSWFISLQATVVEPETDSAMQRQH